LENARNIAAGTIAKRPALYTPEEKIRRDNTNWTLVQGILAPLQFLVFIISLGLVIRTLMTNEGYEIATYSIVLKTLILYAIMITGSIWEKVVFGKYLFAKAFFWEDVFSMLVLALHTAYLLALYFNWLNATNLLILALAAYGAYIINAVQFILKLRAARLQAAAEEKGLSDKVDTFSQANHTAENTDYPQSEATAESPATVLAKSLTSNIGASA